MTEITDRFNLLSVFRAYWKSLSYRTKTADEETKSSPDYQARIAIVLVPLIAGGATAGLGGEIKNAAAFLSATALMSGILLAVFAQLSSLRARYRGELTPQDESLNVREILDESVNGILVAEICTLVGTVLLAVGLSTSKGSSVCGPLAWLSVAVLSVSLIVLLMLIPNLLYAYDKTNDVDPRLSGFHR